MRDQEQLLDILMAQNKSGRGLDLFRRIFGDAERRIIAGRLLHFRISIGMTEAIEVETPDVEAGLVERVAPGFSIEAMRDRERRRKRRPVHVKHRAPRLKLGPRCRQEPQEQRHFFVRPWNTEMLFPWIELR